MVFKSLKRLKFAIGKKKIVSNKKTKKFAHLGGKKDEAHCVGPAEKDLDDRRQNSLDKSLHGERTTEDDESLIFLRTMKVFCKYVYPKFKDTFYSPQRRNKIMRKKFMPVLEIIPEEDEAITNKPTRNI
ncbi:uncharacterized protein LOC124361313 [Homalodisca vitripennis]|nr:uncharacterized protein LOC124361313 [Homalodisca vitripennis]